MIRISLDEQLHWRGHTLRVKELSINYFSASAVSLNLSEIVIPALWACGSPCTCVGNTITHDVPYLGLRISGTCTWINENSRISSGAIFSRFLATSVSFARKILFHPLNEGRHAEIRTKLENQVSNLLGMIYLPTFIHIHGPQPGNILHRLLGSRAELMRN